MHSVKWISVIIFCVGFYVAVAQKKIPLLEREISISVSNESASVVLAQLSAQTGIRFSYSPSLIPADKKVTFKVVKKPLRTVLQLMFADAVQVKEKGHFIILTAKPHLPPQAIVKEITISGYVYDEHGEKLAYASIVNKKEQTAAVTNQYGFYSIKVPLGQFPLDMKIAKENYNDTSVKITAQQKQADIILSIETKPVIALEKKVVADTVIINKDTAALYIPEKKDTILSETINKFKNLMNNMALSNEDKANIRNLKDTLFSSVQFSIIPQLSTNKLLVGNTVNEASLSLLIGYSKGINIASFSGLMNYTAGNVSYMQAAGLCNATEGNLTGGQAAGLINITDGTVSGGQAAGLMNINDSSVTGGQAAGLMNITKGNVKGGQASGFMNIVEGNIEGAQIAGLLNIVEGNSEGVNIAGLGNIIEGSSNGVQIGGLFNIIEGDSGNGLRISGLSNISNDKFDGTQICGVGNICENNTNGLQLAGLFNTCDSVVRGVQVAGLLNDARKVEGFQFAPINFSEENDGIAFGLFCYTKRGYHKLELFGDDVMYTNLAFRTGVEKFHNIFIAGVDLTTRIDKLWSFGYGFGSFHNINDKWRFGGDFTAQLYLQGDKVIKGVQVTHLFIGVERYFGRKFSISFGPVYHIMTNYSGETGVADVITPYSFSDKTFENGTNLRMWAGGKLSLKFF